MDCEQELEDRGLVIAQLEEDLHQSACGVSSIVQKNLFLKNAVDDLTEMLNLFDGKLASVDKQIQEKDQTIKELEIKFLSKCDDYNKLKLQSKDDGDKIQDHEKTIQKLTTSVANTNRHIYSLKQQLENDWNELNRRHEMLSRATQEINRLNAAAVVPSITYGRAQVQISFPVKTSQAL